MGNDWKQKFFDEFSEYWVNVACLSLFVTFFTLHRRLILAHHAGQSTSHRDVQVSLIGVAE